jgi:hypothetical protein
MKAVVIVGNAFIWLLTLAIVAVTSKLLRGGFGEVVYVLNSLFVLLGGRYLAERFNDWATRRGPSSSRR